eukprot:GSMAST32.ASY1.ANO1.896.1 assembled CDS
MNSSRSCHVVNCSSAPGGGFLVDGFNESKLPRNGICIHFLTHFHGDHYNGLKGEKFNLLPEDCCIYATSITASLVISELKVDSKRIKILNLNETVEISNARVTPIDANHCPGACILIFEMDTGNIVHTGDMRFTRSMLY